MYNLYMASVLHRHLITSTHEINCDVIVPMATPATPILNIITRMRSNTAFAVPAAIKYISGLLVSPTALNIAAP